MFWGWGKIEAYREVYLNQSNKVRQLVNQIYQILILSDIHDDYYG